MPDAPINLLNNAVVTSEVQIGFIYSLGASNGSSPVIDFTIWFDQGTSNFVILASNVLTTSYTATALTGGVTY